MTAKAYSIKLVPGADLREELNVLQQILFPDDDMLAPAEGGWWWVAQDHTKAFAGFASMHPKWTKGTMRGLFTRCGVLEAHRGQGLQRRFIRAREAVARHHSLPEVVTTTYSNGPSGNSLIAAGFRLYEPDKPWMCVGTNYWRKTL